MRNWKWMMVAALMVTGCIDVVEPDEGESFDTSEPDPTVVVPGKGDGPYVVQRPAPEPDPTDVVIERPEGECEQESLIGEVDLENERIGEPVITEVFGAGGCVQERWVREWDGERPLTETYEVFVDFLPRNAYVDPAPYVHEWTYDGDGNLIHEQRRTDGRHGFEEWTRYGHTGNVVEVERVHYPSSSTFGVHREITRFDARGRRVRQDVFYDGEAAGSQKWVYDADGNEIEHWRGSGDDMGIQTRRVFVDGLLTRVELLNFQSGELRAETDFERRADGTLERMVTRNHENGWLDIQTYDAAERELVYTQDSDLDGEIDFRKTDEWDADGRLTRQLVEYGFDATGTPDIVSEKTWEYDDHGRLVVATDGSNWRDVPQRTRRIYDAAGPGFTQLREDVEANGAVLVSEEYFLDEDRLQWSRSDIDRDGRLDTVVRQTWDGDRRLSTVTDHGDDGIADSVQRWFYDAAGQLAEHVVDYDGNGDIDARTAHQR